MHQLTSIHRADVVSCRAASSWFAPLPALALLAAGITQSGHSVAGELVVVDSFPSSLATVVACAVDPSGETVWVYGNFDATISRFDADGLLLGTIPRPGEAANDADLEVVDVPFSLNGVALPAGTLVFINGETGPAEIHALDGSTGAVLATLVTGFGTSHVVGGAYHAARGTFFLVQDNVPGGAAANRVAEIDRNTGAVLNSFQTTPAFSVNFGDIEVVSATGNLLVVSSIEASVGEFTPLGAFVTEHPLPAGVSALSGVGVVDALGQAWVSSTGGTIFRLGGLPSACPADLDGDGDVDGGDLGILLGAWGSADPAADLSGDGVVNGADLGVLLGAWGACAR